MNLYLLRHGLAVPDTDVNMQTDRQRPLTPEGLKKSRRVAKALKAMELSFELILSSPYLRAHQTAEVVAREFGLGSGIELADELTPEASPRQLLKKLESRRHLPKDLLLVGHEPFLSSLISLMLCGSLEPRVVLKKSGLAKLSVISFQPESPAILEWLLTPKQMLLMV